MESLARMATGRVDRTYGLTRPFSNFHFLSDHQFFKSVGCSLSRLFCEGRRANSSTLAVEDLDESEETLDETNALRNDSLKKPKLWRLTFWSDPHDESRPFSPSNDSLLGYAIVRADFINCKDDPVVHIFESVFRKYAHFHNFVPDLPEFEINFASKNYVLPGVMYCQQNGITKACAQVALRSCSIIKFTISCLRSSL